MKRCFFFGTFDPIHLGHLILANAALAVPGIETVVFVPTADPPHKAVQGASAAHRLQMVRLATENHPQFQVCDIEHRLPSPHYTVETLCTLFPDLQSRHKIPVLLGQDALASLSSWHRVEDLLQWCHFLQAPRESEQPISAVMLSGKSYPISTELLQMPLIGISSTDIRQRLAQGESIRYLVPDAVRRYSQDNTLYRQGDSHHV